MWKPKLWFALLGVSAALAASASASAASTSTYGGSTAQRLPISVTVNLAARRVTSLTLRYRCGRSLYALTARKASGIARLGKRGDFRYNAPRSSRMSWVSGRIAGGKISGRIAATRKGCRVFAVYAANRRPGSRPPATKSPSSLKCRAPQLPALVTPEGAARHLTSTTRPRGLEHAMCWPPLTYSGTLTGRATFSEEGHGSSVGSRTSSGSSKTIDVGGTATFMLIEAWSPPTIVGKQPNGIVGTYKVITPNISWTLASTSSQTEERFSSEVELIPGGFFSTTKTCTESVAGASSETPEAIGRLKEDGEARFYLNMPSPPVIERCTTTFSDNRPTQELTIDTYVRDLQVGALKFEPGRFNADGFLKGSYGGALQGSRTDREDAASEGHTSTMIVTRTWSLTAAS